MMIMTITEEQKLIYLKEKLEIKKYLKLIQELGNDTSKIELILTKIEQELMQSIDESYQNLSAEELTNNLLKDGRIEWCYRNAITKLDKVKNLIQEEYNNAIKKDGFYHEIDNNMKTIKNRIKDVTEENLTITIELMISLLFSIKNIDKSKEYLANQIYKLTYQVIKLELIYKRKSILLEEVKKSDLNTINVEKYLLEEIQTLDLSKKENEKIKIRYNELKTKGLDNNFLDDELLNLLKFHNHKKDLSTLEKKLVIQVQDLEQQQKEIKDKKIRKNNLEKELEEVSINKKRIQNHLIRHITLIIGQLALVITTMIGANAISKKVSTINYVSEHKTTYDINKDEVKKEQKEIWLKWILTLTDSRILKQYNPWYDKETEENGLLSHDYYQEVLTYDLSSLNYEDIRDYASINLEDYTPSVTEEKSDHIHIEDVYQEPQYIITEIHYDLDNIYQKQNNLLYGILLAISEVGALSLEIFLLNNRFQIRLRCIKTAIESLQKQKEEQIELEKELYELNQTLSLIENNHKTLQNNLLEELKYLPASNNQELNKVKRKIKENTISKK